MSPPLAPTTVTEIPVHVYSFGEDSRLCDPLGEFHIFVIPSTVTLAQLQKGIVLRFPVAFPWPLTLFPNSERPPRANVMEPPMSSPMLTEFREENAQALLEKIWTLNRDDDDKSRGWIEIDAKDV